MRAILAASLLALALPAHADSPKDLGATVGVLAVANDFHTARIGQPLAQIAVDAQQRVGERLLWGLWGQWLIPFSNDGVTTSFSAGFLAGARFEQVRFLAGVLFQVAAGSPAMRRLPTLTASFGSGRWHPVVGVFDRYGTVPFRVGVETERFGASFLALYGLEAWGRYPISETLQIEARAMAFDLLGAQTMNVTAGVHWTPRGAP